MSEPRRETVDNRHPAWCSRAHCEWGRSDILGSHRSAPVPVMPETSIGGRSELWLAMPIHDDPQEAAVYVYWRITYETVGGEVDRVETFVFGLTEASQTGSVLRILAGRGEDRTLVEPRDWR